MTSIAKRFFGAALVFGILGMLLGLKMAMSHDHGQMPTHAHIMVIGWLSFGIFAFFYQLYGELVSKTLAAIHFWLALVSLSGLVAGLYLIYGGNPQYEPVAAISSLGYAASFVLFAVVAWPAFNRGRNPA